MKTILCFILLSTGVYVWIVGTAFAEEKGCRYLYDKGEKKAYIDCLKTNCDKGVLRACGDLGLAYNIRDLYISDEKKVEGIKILESSCTQKDGASCLTLAILNTHKNSTYNNIDKGISFAKKGCDLGVMASCMYVVEMALDNKITDKMVFDKKHEQYVFKISEKLCNDNVEYIHSSCFTLGDIYLHGKVVKHDTEKAIEAYKKGCNLKQHNACFKMAQIYIEGRFVNKDLKIADEFKKLGQQAQSEFNKKRKQIKKENNLSVYYY